MADHCWIRACVPVPPRGVAATTLACGPRHQIPVTASTGDSTCQVAADGVQEAFVNEPGGDQMYPSFRRSRFHVAPDGLKGKLARRQNSSPTAVAVLVFRAGI